MVQHGLPPGYYLATVDGQPTLSMAPSAILALSPWSFIVEDRLASSVRAESKGRKSGDCPSIEASLSHREAIGSTSEKTSEGSFVVEVGEEVVPGSLQVGDVRPT